MSRRASAERPDAASGLTQKWHHFVDRDGQASVRTEINDIVMNVPTPNGREPGIFEWTRRQGELKSLIERAERGDLQEGDDAHPHSDWSPVRRNPLLRELRWRMQARTEARFYFSEPPETPGKIIGLRLHIKDTTGSDQDVSFKQNLEMDVAGDRLEQGRGWAWGVPTCTLPCCTRA